MAAGSCGASILNFSQKYFKYIVQKYIYTHTHTPLLPSSWEESNLCHFLIVIKAYNHWWLHSQVNIPTMLSSARNAVPDGHRVFMGMAFFNADELEVKVIFPYLMCFSVISYLRKGPSKWVISHTCLESSSMCYKSLLHLLVDSRHVYLPDCFLIIVLLVSTDF